VNAERTRWCRAICLLLVLLGFQGAAIPSNSVNDRWPRFSPDGRVIAFMSTRDGPLQAYAMRVDGTGLERIARKLDPPATYGGVSWLHDGSMLLTVYRPTMANGSDNGLALIEFVELDTHGEAARTLYAGINTERPDASSPNGSIVFEHELGPFQSHPPIDIVTFDPNSLRSRTLTGGDGTYVQAAWSPDGTRIAACARPGQPLEICLMRSDGSEAHAITRGTGSHQWPAWSPDGKHVAYFLEDRREGRVDASIGAVDVDGKNERLITGHTGVRRDETPSWSPAGDLIAFQTDRGGNGFRIAVMNPDGSNVRLLTR
jgi:Tol biopolymer transport system component